MKNLGLKLAPLVAVALLAGCSEEILGEVEVPDRKAFENSFYPTGGFHRNAVVQMVQEQKMISALLRPGRYSPQQVDLSARSVCAHTGSELRLVEPIKSAKPNTFDTFDNLIFHCK